MADPGASIEQRFYRAMREGTLPQPRQTWSLDQAELSGPQLLELFESQVLSSQLDFHARRLHALKQGFYTIGSSGHEGNAAVARALRPAQGTGLLGAQRSTADQHHRLATAQSRRRRVQLRVVAAARRSGPVAAALMNLRPAR